MTPKRLTAIRERCEKASQGPWRWQDRYDFREHAVHRTQGLDADCENVDDGRITLEGPRASVLAEWAENAGDSGLNIQRNDAEFIAHAREDVPYLLDQLQIALTRAEQAEKALERMTRIAKGCGEQADKMTARFMEAEAARARLLPYVQHKENCHANACVCNHGKDVHHLSACRNFTPLPCTCGLDAALPLPSEGK